MVHHRVLAGILLASTAVVLGGCKGDDRAPPSPSGESPPAAAPGHVVVRSAHAGSFPIEVHCEATERVIGGGCVGANRTRSLPIDYGETDTKGAGWFCDGNASLSGGNDAYVLCQGTEPVPQPSPGEESEQP